MAIFIAKLLDFIGFIIAGATVIFIKPKWGIPIAGMIASFSTILIVQATGRSLPADLMALAFFAGIIAHSIHAGIVYYIKQLITKKKIINEA
ncbi:hypothetical protein [Halomonas sp. KM-1]|uniref:hypothetical protein n=1 Tax=Halomonas sp. KM-1 TaxID=590061 RepID=UPI001147608D|nr:hypothetical protein [Halomonas sp. KM-1]